MGIMIERKKSLMMQKQKRLIPIIYDASTNGKYIGADGSIGSSNNFHYSELLPVFVGGFTYKFTSGNASINRNTRIHGYNENGTWVKQVAYMNTWNGTYEIQFNVTQDVKYIRISNTTFATNESVFTIA